MTLPDHGASTPPPGRFLPRHTVLIDLDVIHLLECLPDDDRVVLVEQLHNAARRGDGAPTSVRPDGWGCPCGRVFA